MKPQLRRHRLAQRRKRWECRHTNPHARAQNGSRPRQKSHPSYSLLHIPTVVSSHCLRSQHFDVGTKLLLSQPLPPGLHPPPRTVPLSPVASHSSKSQWSVVPALGSAVSERLLRGAHSVQALAPTPRSECSRGVTRNLPSAQESGPLSAHLFLGHPPSRDTFPNGVVWDVLLS